MCWMKCVFLIITQTLMIDAHQCFIYDPVFVAFALKYMYRILLSKLIKYCKTNILFEQFIKCREKIIDLNFIFDWQHIR